MPPLHKKWFKNEGDINAAMAKAILANDLVGVNAVLGKFGWQGARGAGIAIELTPDNKRAARAQFFLHGVLTEDTATVAASKIWEKADRAATVSITIPPGQEFSFVNGSLASEYVQQEAFKFSCRKNDSVILPTDYQAHGIGNITLRAVAYLDKSSNGANGPKIKFTVLVFPASEEDMLEMSDLAADVGWPGVKLLEGSAELCPPPPVEGWGCPMLPIVIPATNPEAMTGFPSGGELRFAIAKVMATARLPVPCTAAAPMHKRWQKLIDDPSSMEERIPSVIWPVPQNPPAQPEGKNSII